jgi:hypothetical protein
MGTVSHPVRPTDPLVVTLRALVDLARMRFPLYPSARVPRRRATRYPLPGYEGDLLIAFKKITATACHASAPLRWSHAVLAGFWCRSFSSAGRGHAMVRSGCVSVQRGHRRSVQRLIEYLESALRRGGGVLSAFCDYECTVPARTRKGILPVYGFTIHSERRLGRGN